MRPFMILCTILTGNTVALSTSRVPQTFRLSSHATPEISTVALTSADYGQMYDANITIGGHTMPILVDTGSSDLWVLGSDWVCLNDTSNSTLSRADCNFGPGMYSAGSTFEVVKDEYFGEQLGNGRVSGQLGRDEITFAGITVKNATFGVVKNCSNNGDGINSGILGLGYPSMTSAHAGSLINADNSTFDYNRTNYDNLIVHMAKQGLIDPYFSLALDRSPINSVVGRGGYLTLGGLPPVAHSGKFASVAVEVVALPKQYWINGTLQRSWWAANIDGIKYGDIRGGNVTINSSSFPAVFDSGNFFNFLPTATLESLAKLWSPPAVRKVVNPSWPSLYSVPCNATAPRLAYSIGGQDFWIEGRDLLFQLGPDICVAAFLATEDVSYAGVITGAIMGAPFYQSVVAVHDFGKNEMRFAARTDAQANTSSTQTVSSPMATKTTALGGNVPTSSGTKRRLAGGTWFGMLLLSWLMV